MSTNMVVFKVSAKALKQARANLKKAILPLEELSDYAMANNSLLLEYDQLIDFRKKMDNAINAMDEILDLTDVPE